MVYTSEILPGWAEIKNVLASYKCNNKFIKKWLYSSDLVYFSVQLVIPSWHSYKQPLKVKTVALKPKMGDFTTLDWTKHFSCYLCFLSQTLTIHVTAGEERGHLYSSLPLPPAYEVWTFICKFVFGLKIHEWGLSKF